MNLRRSRIQTCISHPVAVFMLLTTFYSGAAQADLFEDAVSGNAETDPETDPEEAESPEPTSKWNFDLNGHIRSDMFVGKREDENRAEIKNAYGELGLKLRVNRAPCADAFGDLRFKFGHMNDAYLGEPPSSGPSGAELGELSLDANLRELYINMYMGPLDVRIGHQIIVWGRADGINPTNNLTPIDMRVRSPQEDDRRMGNLALRANLNFSPIRIEGVFIPLYSPSYLPKVKLMDGIGFSEPDYPDRDLHAESILLAGRFHLLLPAFEASISYLRGNALVPGLALDTFTLDYDPKSITLKRAAYAHHVLGFDFSTTLGDFLGLRGEIAYRHPTDYSTSVPLTDPEFYLSYSERVHIPNPDLYYVIGADKEFGNLSVIAQYIGRYVVDVDPVPDKEFLIFESSGQTPILEDDYGDLESIPDGYAPETYQMLVNREVLLTNRLLQGQTEQVQHAASVRLELKTMHDQLSLVAFSMMNFTTKEWLVYPKVTYFVTDAMALAVGAEIYRGPDDSLFAMIEDVLTAGYAELKLSF